MTGGSATQVWAALIAAGLLETGFILALRQAEGFSRLGPGLLAVACFAGSLALLSVAMRDLPAGVAYAVWTGLGVAGAAVAGMALHGDDVSILRVLGSVFVVAGIGCLAAAR